MTSQEAVTALEAWLRAHKDANPRHQAAWEMLFDPNDPLWPNPHAWRVTNWPDGAVRGLLEFDLLKELGWHLHGYSIKVSGSKWGGVAVHANIHDGMRKNWHGDGENELEALFRALMEALNDHD